MKRTVHPPQDKGGRKEKGMSENNQNRETDSDFLYVKDGCYYWKEGKQAPLRISNFIIVGLYLLKSSDPSFSKRILTIKNVYGINETITVLVKDMVNLSQFRAVIEGKGNFILYANNRQFNAIKEFEVMNVEGSAIEITIPGYQSEYGFYAFSNGIFNDVFHPIDKYGLVKIKELSFYLPALSIINVDAAHIYHNEQKFIFQQSEITFSKWAKLIVQAYGPNGMIAMAYVIASIFRDLIFKHIECFPLLYLFGPPEMGKSTFTESFQRLFGEPQSPIGLGTGSSTKGYSRKLAQFRNAIIVFEEYKNGIKPELIEMLKNVFDGFGYERAQMTNDNKTHSTPVLSAVIMPGQQMPTKESALFSRVILLEFLSKKFDAKTSKAYEELKEWEHKGLGSVIGEILSLRKSLENIFISVYKEIFKSLKSDKEVQNLSDRNIKKMACILAPIKALASNKVSNPLDLSFTYDELYHFLKKKLIVQSQIMERVNEVNQFWSIIEYLVDKEQVLRYGFDFIVEEKEGVKQLFLPFDRVYGRYNTEAQKQNLDVLDKETLRSYLKIQNYFISPPNSTKGKAFKKRGFIDGAQRSCYCFALDQTGLNDELFKATTIKKL